MCDLTAALYQDYRYALRGLDLETNLALVVALQDPMVHAMTGPLRWEQVVGYEGRKLVENGKSNMREAGPVNELLRNAELVLDASKLSNLEEYFLAQSLNGKPYIQVEEGILPDAHDDDETYTKHHVDLDILSVAACDQLARTFLDENAGEFGRVQAIEGLIEDSILERTPLGGPIGRAIEMVYRGMKKESLRISEAHPTVDWQEYRPESYMALFGRSGLQIFTSYYEAGMDAKNNKIKNCFFLGTKETWISACLQSNGGGESGCQIGRKISHGSSVSFNFREVDGAIFLLYGSNPEKPVAQQTFESLMRSDSREKREPYLDLLKMAIRLPAVIGKIGRKVHQDLSRSTIDTYLTQSKRSAELDFQLAM